MVSERIGSGWSDGDILLNWVSDIALRICTGGPLSNMVVEGALDSLVSARVSKFGLCGCRSVNRMREDFRTSEKEYYKKTRIFPIMRSLGM